MQSLCATNAFAATRRRVAGRRTVSVKAQRTLWLPSATAPAHLDGTLPGDNGFDPLGLGVCQDWIVWALISGINRFGGSLWARESLSRS